MIGLRIALRGSLVTPILALALFWVGVAGSIEDRGLVHDMVPSVADPDSDVSPASHDHRLCLLFQSSPGWASPSAALLDRPVVPGDSRPWHLDAWIPTEGLTSTLARAPPSSI